MNKTLKNLVEDPVSNHGRTFTFLIQVLIIISLVSFSIGTLPNIPDSTKNILQFIELFIVIIFTFEYFLRIIVADNKLKFIFSFYGIIDLAAILPFYIASGIDLRSIRVFRLLRLFRVMKLFRYNQAINRFYRAFSIAKEELILFSFISMILLYLSSVGIYYFESNAQPEQFASIFHSLWWAVITLTTVGYGDIYPITVGGRIFTFFVLMIGLGIIAVPTGLVASALSQARIEEISKE